ncbi:adenosylcobinamide-phosphate synthase CbiB [Geminocystis sp. NIES-3709]|uniref:adenosylcobinamide-phosphate synthase CbiB n=1 Tax=Geminocystis sp. NIES-3709 TaxID=1617448 RepID=UPI0009E7897D|nr:adenosylcobinamide-phosphate synthase CbiB [Geminocystis sp. NIES-3709]
MNIIWLACILDYFIGDPWGWIHPVQVMGWIIQGYHQFIVDRVENKQWRKIAGVLLGLGLIIGSGGVTWLLIAVATKINYYGGIVVQVILLASCFAGKSLRQAAEDVLFYVKQDDLSQARYRLSFYVGRDTHNLSKDEILRAVLETVAENSVDGVTAPLFYALLGVFFPVIGCVPFAIGYKAVSTLDSMIGYKKEPFIDIGWFSAKLEDILTWLPCRLTVLTLGVLSGKPIQHITECKKYAYKDPSPNSGWSEAIYAVILRVQLGGENTYKGEKKYKPLLGKSEKQIDINSIEKALSLTRNCFFLWLSVITLIKKFLV